MNLILSGRGVKLDDRLRGYATEKFSKVERFFDRITKMEVELRTERNPRVHDPHRVEVTVSTPRETLRAHGEGADHFAAIDAAVGRLEIQVKRFKERLRGHAHRPDHRVNGSAAEVADDASDLVARSASPFSKPMSTDEAIMELDASGMNFVLFTSDDTNRAAVVYRRADGGFGLIDQ